MKIVKIHWANGKPALDFQEYEYSEAWFFKTALMLEDKLEINAEKLPVIALDAYVVEYPTPDGLIVFHMDNDTCSVAFPTEAMCDDALQKIS